MNQVNGKLYWYVLTKMSTFLQHHEKATFNQVHHSWHWGSYRVFKSIGSAPKKRVCELFRRNRQSATERERESIYIYLVVGGSGLIKLAGRRWRCWKQKGEPLSQAAEKWDENGGNGNRSLISNLRIVLWTSAAKGKTEGTDSFLLITHFLIKSSVTLMDDVHTAPKGLYVFIMQRTRALCSRVARNHKSQSAINFKFGSIVTLFQQPHLLPQQYTSSLIS